MPTSLPQSSFGGGEISPALWGRTDWERYAISVKKCKDFMVMPYGGLRNRPGTVFVDEAKEHAKVARLVTFANSTLQAYALEFGDYYMRAYKNGARVLVSLASAYSGAVTYTSGQCVSSAGSSYVSLVDGNVGNTPASSPTYWRLLEVGAGGLPIMEIGTPWSETDVFDLGFTQSVDVLTVCHTGGPQYQISRNEFEQWSISEMVFENGPFDEKNTDPDYTVYSSGTSGSVQITGVPPVGESMFAAEDVGKLLFIEQKNAGAAWVPATAVITNQIARASGRYWAVLGAGTTGTDKPGIDDPEAKDDWNDGGVDWRFLHPGFGVAKVVTITSGNVLTATAYSRIPDAAVGSGGATQKWAWGAWNDADGYPGCSTYHQQRQFFAGSPAFPQTIWGSKTDDYTNFGSSSPAQDDDSLTYPLASRQVNAVRHLLGMGGALLAFAGDAIWTITGSDNQGVLTPSVVQAKPQTALGCSRVAPLLVGNTVLYIQDKGQAVHDLMYSFAEDSYTGDDLSTFAQHLVEGYEIVDWAFQSVPYSIVWAVRSDGVLLGLTYMRSQKVVAWHQHDIGGGIVESVCCVSEGNEDALYLLVKRTINGSVVRYVERMASRQFTDIEDAFFVDCGLSYNGWNTTATTITLSGGSTWDHGEEFTATASGALFQYPATTDVGDELVFVDTDGTRYALEIRSTASTTVATVMPNRLIPVAYRNTARTDWGMARDTFTLTHLEGETVNILSDGNVLTPAEVTSGVITLGSPGVVVHAGLPIEADIETLDLSVQGAETIRDKKKRIISVSVQVENSRGLFVGMDADHLEEWKQPGMGTFETSIDLFTGLADGIVIRSEASKDVTLFIRQSDPLPLSILSVIPVVDIGGV